MVKQIFNDVIGRERKMRKSVIQGSVLISKMTILTLKSTKISVSLKKNTSLNNDMHLYHKAIERHGV